MNGGKMEQQTTLVRVHPADNGVVNYVADSNTAKVGKTAAMTLALGPLGLLAGANMRGLRAECSACGKVFKRSDYSAVIEKHLMGLVARGELLLRAYTPPPIAEYDPNEAHAPVASEMRKTRKKEDDKLYGPVAWALALSLLLWMAFFYSFTDHFKFEFGYIVRAITLAVISCLLTWWLINSSKELFRVEKSRLKDKKAQDTSDNK